jgi:phosphatidate cytidylyltransferase
MVILAPPGIFSAFIGVLAAWGLYEIKQMTSASPPQSLILFTVGFASTITLLLSGRGPWLPPCIVLAAMVILVIQIGRGAGVSHGTGFMMLGALWVGVLFPYFAFLRNAPEGTRLTILMLLLVVATDSGAYFVGRQVGRLKLLPKVSPNKTIEGAAGGLGACIIAALILWMPLASDFSVTQVSLLALAIGILSQLGDLANSAYKRVAKVKDSGWIFPGHGGLLDRTCSLVFAAVLTYYYVH